MTLGTLHRVLAMPRAELVWRARAHARTAVQRVAVRLHPPRWDRRDIERVLANAVLTPGLRAASAARDWLAVHDALAAALRARPSRFVLDPRRRDELRQHICGRWPSAPTVASERADRILAGQYDVLGYRGVAFGADWHLDPVHRRRAPLRFWADVPYLDPRVGDHKIIWELNRHQHWLQLGRALWLTGDPTYGAAIVNRLDGWLAANPPLVGINWASMLEIGLRAISWTWALHFLLAGADSSVAGAEAPALQVKDAEHRTPDSGAACRAAASAAAVPWLVDLFVGLDRQLTHVEQHLSYYFSPNTHLIGEGLALYVVGLAVPELAASRRWVDTGRRILLAEISRQIHADGGHVERSTHYQRYALDFYLLALLMAERTGDLVAIPRFRDAVTRLADFTRTLADDDGRLPLIGDDDGGMLWPIAGRACSDVRDSLALAALVLGRPDLAPWGAPEEVVWIAGRAPIDDSALDEKEELATIADHEGPRRLMSCAGTASRTFADTGCVVMRDGGGGHAVFDAGAHGYLNGGHAHADALALTLTLAGRPLLVDPGTSTYTVDPHLRDRLRGSASHNTVTLDNQPQALPGGPFSWRTRANGRLHAWRHNAAFDWAEASHDGYTPLRHLRLIFRSARSGWLIVDEVSGGGRHSASACWHFDPAWTVACDAPGRLHAVHLDGDAAWLLHDGDEAELAHGDQGRGLGWYAPVYGTLVPTWTARVTRGGVTPFAMATWIGMSEGNQSDPPSLERVATACEAGECVVGVRIVANDRTSTFLLRAEDPAKGGARWCGIQDYETDARALHCLERRGELVALELVDTSYASTSRAEGTSITASETVADLHAAVDGPALELFASAPPSQLRIEGGAVRRTRVVRANGREIPRDGPGTGAVAIARGQWGPHPSRRPDPAGRTAPALTT